MIDIGGVFVTPLAEQEVAETVYRPPIARLFADAAEALVNDALDLVDPLLEPAEGRRDLGGELSTDKFADAVIDRLA